MGIIFLPELFVPHCTCWIDETNETLVSDRWSWETKTLGTSGYVEWAFGVNRRPWASLIFAETPSKPKPSPFIIRSKGHFNVDGTRILALMYGSPWSTTSRYVAITACQQKRRSC